MHLYGRHIFVMEKKVRISNDFSSEASGQILLKFNVGPPWGTGMKDC